MIGWQRPSLVVLSATLLLTGGVRSRAGVDPVSPAPDPASAAACPNVRLLMLPWLTARDTATASKAGKELRNALDDKFDSKEWCVIPKERTDAYLKASQFSTTTPLSDMDALQLAGPVRADVFLQAEYKDFQYTGSIFYVGDDHAWMREKVPATPAARGTSQAASAFAQKIKDVLKAYPSASRCLSLARRQQDFAAADSAAKQAIAAYPDGVIGRYCLALAMQGENRPPDDVLKVVNDVLARDSTNPRALILAIQLYEAKSDTAAYERVARKFAVIDPTNIVVESIVQRLADWHRTDAALAFIATSLQGDDENKTLLSIQLRLIYSAGRWKEAAAKGEALAKLDSTVVDSFFVRRMVSAYSKDSQPEKVLAWLKTGTEKFPENTGFAIGYAQQLVEMNQTPKALDVYKRLLRLFPETPEIRLRIANTYHASGQTDSAIAWLHEADKHGDDKGKIAGVALQIGNALFTAAGQTRALADFDKAIPVLAFSDSVQASETAKFLWGGSLFLPAAPMVTGLEANWSCDVAKSAQSRIQTAQPLIMAGGKTAPDNAASWLNAITSYIPYLDGAIKGHRCS